MSILNEIKTVIYIEKSTKSFNVLVKILKVRKYVERGKFKTGHSMIGPFNATSWFLLENFSPKIFLKQQK